MILVQGEPSERRVFWVRRGKGSSFGPGMYAFPGGKVEAEDGRTPVANAPPGEEAFLVAAVREAFEEVGILLAAGADALSAADLAEMRKELAEGASFAALLASRGLSLDAAGIASAGRWLTPDFSPIRFDTRFFLARAPEGRTAKVDERELASGAWIRPAEALELWERGQALLHPPTHHALAILAGFPIEKAVPLLRDPPFVGDDHVVSRIEFQRGIHVFPLRTPTLPPATHTNCYVVGTGEMVAIDPGSPFPEEKERIAAELLALQGEGRRLRAVLLTHHHTDHVAGAADLAGRFGVPLLASPETARRVPGAEGALGEGEVLRLEGPMPMRLRTLLTEGHAPGHLCFLEEGSGALLVGDMVADGSTIVIDPPEGRMDLYLQSLERLRSLPAQVLYPAHGFPIPDGIDLLDRYLSHREERMRAIHALLVREGGSVSLARVVENVYSDTPSPLHPVAERSALASLIELGRRGLAIEKGEGWAAT